MPSNQKISERKISCGPIFDDSPLFESRRIQEQPPHPPFGPTGKNAKEV
jgi:hypothetical protein